MLLQSYRKPRQTSVGIVHETTTKLDSFAQPHNLVIHRAGNGAAMPLCYATTTKIIIPSSPASKDS